MTIAWHINSSVWNLLQNCLIKMNITICTTTHRTRTCLKYYFIVVCSTILMNKITKYCKCASNLFKDLIATQKKNSGLNLILSFLGMNFTICSLKRLHTLRHKILEKRSIIVCFTKQIKCSTFHEYLKVFPPKWKW